MKSNTSPKLNPVELKFETYDQLKENINNTETQFFYDHNIQRLKLKITETANSPFNHFDLTASMSHKFLSQIFKFYVHSFWRYYLK